MRNLWGGLLASSATAALSIGFVDPSLCSMSDGSIDTGGGGAAGLLDDEDPAAAAAAAAAASGTPTPTPTPTPAPAAGEVPEWLKSFSAEKTGDELSHQEWITKAGVKDLDGLAKIARDNQKALRESGRVKIPGADASPEEISAYREAVGAPPEPAGYDIEMPEGADNYALDTEILDPLREVAHKHNLPAAAFKELGGVFLAAALEDAKAEVSRTDQEAQAQIKEWGADAGQKKEEFRRGAQLLGLNKKDIADIQREFGGGRTLELFAKIGALAGEDFFATGDAAQRFGVANLEQAQKALDTIVNDPVMGKALSGGTADEGLKARYNRAVEAVAAFKEADSKKR